MLLIDITIFINRIPPIRDVSDSQRGRAGVRAIQRRDIPPRDVACVGEARRVPVGGVYQVNLSTPDWPRNSSQ